MEKTSAMTSEKRATAAVLSMFPNLEALDSFVEDSKHSYRLDSFIDFAKKHHIIPSAQESEFRQFISENSLGVDQCIPQPGVTFEEIINNKSEWLGVDVSTRKLTDTINAFLTDNHLELTSVSNSIISRLKRESANTPHKRDTLRAIAFWLGWEKTHLAPSWNYYVLAKICPAPETVLSEKEGISLHFKVRGTGREKVVEWLKYKIKKCVQYLGLHHIDLKRMAISPTSLTLNLPKLEGPSDDPILFGKAAQEGLAILHQVLTRFYLSDLYGINDLITGVTAGDFLENRETSRALVDAFLPEGNDIRFNNFAYLCVKLDGIKVIFHQTPLEVRLPNGQLTTTWALKSFWCYTYYDFVPQLMDPTIIPDSLTSPSFPEFRNALYFPHQPTAHKVLTVLKRFPQNTLVMLEIAKTLTWRMMFDEANHVLTAVLSSYPHHLVARTLRIYLMINKALRQKNHAIFDQLSRLAIKDGAVFLSSQTVEELDFFCELGFVNLNTAIGHLTFLKNSDTSQPASDVGKKIMRLLEESAKNFREGAIKSSSGRDAHAFFWEAFAIALHRLLASNPGLFESNTPVSDPDGIFLVVGAETFVQNGWSASTIADEAFLELSILDAISHAESTLMMRAYRPGLYFTFASALFDFVPELKVKGLKFILLWIERAKAEAEKSIRDHQTVGTYGLANSLHMIVPADIVLKQINAGLRIVRDITRAIGDAPDDTLVRRDQFPAEYIGVKLTLLGLNMDDDHPVA